MKIVEELDSGPVCNVYKFQIENNYNAEEISKNYLCLQQKKFWITWMIFLKMIKFIEQDHSKATYAKKLKMRARLIGDWGHQKLLVK